MACSFLLLLLLLLYFLWFLFFVFLFCFVFFYLMGELLHDNERQLGADFMIPVIPHSLCILTWNHSYRELTDISILSCFIHLRYVVRTIKIV